MQPSWYDPPRADVPPPAPPPDAESRPTETVGFWMRAVARIADTIAGSIVGVVSGVLSAFVLAMLAAMGTVDPGWQTRMQEISTISFVYGAIGTVAYHTVAEGMGGATIGKLVCGLRVLREDDSPATLGGAFVRSLAYFVDSFFCGAIAWSTITGSPRHQRLGDRWGHTVVVRAATVPAASARNPALGIVVAVVAQAMCAVIGTILRVA